MLSDDAANVLLEAGKPGARINDGGLVRRRVGLVDGGEDSRQGRPGQGVVIRASRCVADGAASARECVPDGGMDAPLFKVLLELSGEERWGVRWRSGKARTGTLRCYLRAPPAAYQEH